MARRRITAMVLSTFVGIISLPMGSTETLAKDAFGLDAFKASVEKLTKPDHDYQTKYGSPLIVYSISNPSKTTTQSIKSSKNIRFLVEGGLHGNELLGSEFVGWLAQRFAAGQSSLNKLNGGDVEIDFIPYANPDGTLQYTRYNGNKINLNRNFEVLWGTTKENPGPKAFSESETRAIRDLFLTQDYSGAIDIHGYVNWVVIPTAPDDPKQNEHNRKSMWAKSYNEWSKMIRAMTDETLPGYEVKTAGGLGDGGAFEDFAWWGAHVPAACLEVFSNERYVNQSFAEKIINLFSLGSTAHTGQTSTQIGTSDTFLTYESYVNQLFTAAIRLKEHSIQSSVPPKQITQIDLGSYRDKTLAKQKHLSSNPD